MVKLPSPVWKISFRFLWTLKFVYSPAHDGIQEIFSCRIAVYISYLCDFQFFRFLLSLNQTLKLVCQITCNFFCCERGAGTKAWSFSSPPPTGLSVSSSGCFSCAGSSTRIPQRSRTQDKGADKIRDRVWSPSQSPRSWPSKIFRYASYFHFYSRCLEIVAKLDMY